MSALVKIRAIVVEGEPSADALVPVLLALEPWRVSMDAIVDARMLAPVVIAGQPDRRFRFAVAEGPAPAPAMSERALAKQRTAQRAAARIDAIIELVAVEYQVERAMIVGASRGTQLVPVRAAIAWLARYVGGFSSTQVAWQMGPRDHTSILSSSKSAFELRERDGAFKALTDRLAVTVREMVK